MNCKKILNAVQEILSEILKSKKKKENTQKFPEYVNFY